MHTLYVIATPIGNLEDVSARALRILSQVQLIAAEDTRVTRKLLARYDIKTRLVSYHEHSKRAKLEELLSALENHDVALVTDAGTPGISDPGADLVAVAAEQGATVVPIPGPSAVATAIAASGIPVDGYVFAGFLPRKPADRRRLLSEHVRDTRALVAFETPQRLIAALQDIHDTFGERRIAVCRELTKLHEEIYRGTVSQAVAHFTEPRGEFTLVIAAADPASTSDDPDFHAIALRIVDLRRNRLTAKQATETLTAEFGLSRRQAYSLWLETPQQT
ncbi:MAG: 16S rRNA (cytidine(1402)-2'-O)-methyltransferase [Chloroflexi bacterium]|nr:16S rRNA (cytidine(1402)-2'-O)-methyltransferase [Chloroflexota bacterium]